MYKKMEALALLKLYWLNTALDFVKLISALVFQPKALRLTKTPVSLCHSECNMVRVVCPCFHAYKSDIQLTLTSY